MPVGTDQCHETAQAAHVLEVGVKAFHCLLCVKASWKVLGASVTNANVRCAMHGVMGRTSRKQAKLSILKFQTQNDFSEY